MTVTYEMLQEAVLTFSQRRKRAQTLKKFANKIQIARKRALKRLAGTNSIENRARKAAIKIVRKIVAGKLGLTYNELSVPQKMAIDVKVQKKAKLIAKLTTRLIPKMRKAELERFKNLKQAAQVNEGAGAGKDGTIELVNTYVEDTPFMEDPFQPGQNLDKQYFYDRYGHNAEEIMRLISMKIEDPKSRQSMKTSERARKTDGDSDDAV